MKKLLTYFLIYFCVMGLAQAEVPEGKTGVSFAPLVEKLLPGVVNISTRHESRPAAEKPEISSPNDYIRDYFLQDDGGRTSLGSGFLIDSKGYIVTNSHVIENADKILVTLNTNKEYQATVVGTDKVTDLALIKISAEEAFPFVKLGNSDELRVGDWILAIGNPFGLGGSVTAGIVSAKSRDIDVGAYDNFIQTDASINQGSSGGPMFNMEGEVVGINTAIFSSNGTNMGIGFATPVNLSKFVIEQLIAKGKVERGWIGVKVSTNEEKISLSETQDVLGGAVVVSLTPQSPAASAGIEVGDVVIALNGAEIKDAKDFSRKIAETPLNKEVILRVWRLSGLKDISVKVGAMPEKADLKSEETTKNSSVSLPPEGYVEDLGLVLNAENNTVFVREVLGDSEAYEKGIKSGDILVKIDGRDISSIEDVRSYIAYAKAAGGPPIELNIMSNGLPQTIHLKTGE